MQQHRFNVRSYGRARAAVDFDFMRNLAASEVLISELCNRYQIRGKSILSLGGGDCAREYWMAPANRVTMVGTSDPAWAGQPDIMPSDRYVVDDPRAFVRSCRDTFDVLFVAGAPAAAQDGAHHCTAEDAFDPLLRLAVAAASLVKQGGLVIIQHSPRGIDANPGVRYFNDLADQFDRHGVRLAEAYHLRTSPERLLVTATKSDIAGQMQLQQRLALRVPLGTLRGDAYGDPNRDIVPIDLHEIMSPQKFELQRLMEALRPHRARAAVA